MEVKKGRRPPDGGWGWIVIAGCFIILATQSMISFCYSILFSDFFLSHGASSTTIAWIFNLHLFVYNAIGVFTGPLTKEFGFRPISTFGCLLACVCILPLVFVDSIWGMFVFYPIIGMFSCLGVKPCYILFAQYFDRKRGRANAFLMAGTCIAQFVGAPLMRHLVYEYGRQGATLLLCGIAVQGVVGAAVFQPVEWHMKVDVEEAMVEDEKQEEEKQHDLDAGVTDEMREKEAERRKMLGVTMSRRSSEMSVFSLAVSDLDLSSIPPVSHRGSCSLQNDTNSNITSTADGFFEGIQGFFKATARVLKAVVSDMKILRSPRALIVVCGGMLCINSFLNFLMMVPFAIQDAGYSLSDAAWCISLAAGANLSARLVFSGLSDQPWFNIRFAYMAGAFIFSLTSMVFGFLQSLTLIQVAMVVWGCGVGMNISLYILTMPLVMGLDKMPSIFGVQSLLTSISMIVFGPLFGIIRDTTGSYLASMMTMGCCGGLCVVLWCFMPAAVAYDERKEAAERRSEEREGLPEV